MLKYILRKTTMSCASKLVGHIMIRKKVKKFTRTPHFCKQQRVISAIFVRKKTAHRRRALTRLSSIVAVTENLMG